MSKVPLVSIGVPAYNEERFLRATLASLFAQDYENIEILLTDNGSSDATSSIAAEFAAEHPSLRVVRFPENRGAVHSFNDVFRRATGTYFQWSGGHDLWDSSYVSRCVAVLESDPSVVGVYARTTLIDAEGKPLGDYPDTIDTRGMSLLKRYAYVLWNLTFCNLIHGVWRREHLGRSGLFAQTWGPDNLVIARMSVEGQFARLPEALFFRRQVRPDDASRVQKDKRILLSLDPKTPPKADMRALHVAFRKAHLNMIAGLPVKMHVKFALRCITFYVFAIRYYLFPGGTLVRKIMCAVPGGLKQKVYALLRGR